MFEITDQEAEEIYFTVNKKLTGIKSILEKAEKGTPTHGKNKLLYRVPIMQELVNRLKEHYEILTDSKYKYPNLEV